MTERITLVKLRKKKIAPQKPPLVRTLRLRALAADVLEKKGVDQHAIPELIEQTELEIIAASSRIFDKAHYNIFKSYYIDHESKLDMSDNVKLCKKMIDSNLLLIKNAVIEGIDNPFYYDERVNKSPFAFLIDRIFKEDSVQKNGASDEEKNKVWSQIPGKIIETAKRVCDDSHYKIFEQSFLKNMPDKDVHTTMNMNYGSFHFAKRRLKKILFDAYDNPSYESNLKTHIELLENTFGISKSIIEEIGSKSLSAQQWELVKDYLKLKKHQPYPQKLLKNEINTIFSSMNMLKRSLANYNNIKNQNSYNLEEVLSEQSALDTIHDDYYNIMDVEAASLRLSFLHVVINDNENLELLYDDYIAGKPTEELKDYLKMAAITEEGLYNNLKQTSALRLQMAAVLVQKKPSYAAVHLSSDDIEACHKKVDQIHKQLIRAELPDTQTNSARLFGENIVLVCSADNEKRTNEALQKIITTDTIDAFYEGIEKTAAFFARHAQWAKQPNDYLLRQTFKETVALCYRYIEERADDITALPWQAHRNSAFSSHRSRVA